MAYADVTDLEKYGLPARALQSVSEAQRAAALDAASAEADSYLNLVYQLPLTAWGEDLKAKVCHLAVYDLMANRGYNPSAGQNDTIRTRYQDAVKWLDRVSTGKVRPTGIADSSAGGVNTSETPASFTKQNLPASEGSDSFWGSSSGCSSGGVGTPRRRGW